ncbi:hypothetical protein CLF_113212 [Clonorchis sinensis]|uniref:Reverse transcriptase domain-containing protein n=1 Tax=Clonorchis sinensis TaxID=79923 RepID=G7YXW9_CLOSI|nr:hypothetical protein CLF_113212 [Clonorchis sinensis]
MLTVARLTVARETLSREQQAGFRPASDENLLDLEYADDIVLIFEEEEKAQVFLDELTKVIPSFVCALHKANNFLYSSRPGLCVVTNTLFQGNFTLDSTTTATPAHPYALWTGARQQKYIEHTRAHTVGKPEDHQRTASMVHHHNDRLTYYVISCTPTAVATRRQRKHRLGLTKIFQVRKHILRQNKTLPSVTYSRGMAGIFSSGRICPERIAVTQVPDYTCIADAFGLICGLIDKHRQDQMSTSYIILYLEPVLPGAATANRPQTVQEKIGCGVAIEGLRAGQQAYQCES